MIAHHTAWRVSGRVGTYEVELIVNSEEHNYCFSLLISTLAIKHVEHRRKMKTEEKAKVVAAVWGMELIQFLAALDIFHQDDFEEKDV